MNPRNKILQPPGWPPPRGYSNGIATQGHMVFVSGIVGCDSTGQFQTDDFVSQTRQALQNIVAVLAEASAEPHHIVRMTWYVVNKNEYLKALKELGVAYREVMGSHYPAMTAVEVSALIEDRARVEIEVTAVIPD